MPNGCQVFLSLYGQETLRGDLTFFIFYCQKMPGGRQMFLTIY
jgi:hypothetical protein